jgi:hypothetical protein
MPRAVSASAISDLETTFSGFADPARLWTLNLLAAGEL